MGEREKLSHWMQVWDQHAEQFAKEQAEEQAKKIQQDQQTSFFNDRPSTDNWQDRDDITDDQGWGDLINRSSEFGEEMLHDHRSRRGSKLNEEDGFRQLVRGATPGSDKVNFQQNPQRPWSVGKDQEGEDGLPRVTPNWTDGDDLLELDKIKRDVERMERKYHEADVTGKGGKAKLESELKSIRKRIQNLSEKIQPQVDKDVT